MNKLEISQKELKFPKEIETFDFSSNYNQLKIMNINVKESRNLLIISGFYPGTIDIFENYELIKQLDFHKVSLIKISKTKNMTINQ